MTTTNSSPIGFFDSGIGGITLLNSIKKILPNEKIIYIADNLYSPYGSLSPLKIKKRSFQITGKLISLGCKLIVIACNTATTNSIHELRKNFNVPFIGVEPGIKPASLKSITGTIGVLATKGTLSSSLFSKTNNLHASHIKIIEKEGTGLVELIEDNKINDLKTINLLNSYIKPMIDQNADLLVLGCTHYPLLEPILMPIIKDKMKIVDIGNAVAQQTKKMLLNYKIINSIKNTAKEIYFSTGNVKLLSSFLKNKDVAKIII